MPKIMFYITVTLLLCQGHLVMPFQIFQISLLSTVRNEGPHDVCTSGTISLSTQNDDEKKNKTEADVAALHMDTKYSWLVCGVAFLGNFMTLGFSYGIGIYFAEFRDIFEESAGTTSWVSSFNYGILCMTGIMSQYSLINSSIS